MSELIPIKKKKKKILASEEKIIIIIVIIIIIIITLLQIISCKLKSRTMAQAGRHTRKTAIQSPSQEAHGAQTGPDNRSIVTYNEIEEHELSLITARLLSHDWRHTLLSIG